MKIIRNIPAHEFSRGCVMSIGNFDGIHLGHQSIVSRVIKKSRALGIPSVITTFEPHPHEFFTPDSADRIMGLREKCIALEEYPLDYLFVMRFDYRLANTSADEFIKTFLLNGLNVKSLIIGDDFRFGKKRQGDYELLKKYSDVSNFELENTNTLEIDDQRISSTRVRQLLQNHEFAKARELLGRPYFVSGRVRHGDKRGRQLGFPTLNIGLKKNRTLLTGVFAVEIHGLGEIKKAVANMGFRPTIQGHIPQLEAHVFDFDEQCYGKQISVLFRKKLRDEKRFESIELLTQQIHADVQQAREYFNLQTRSNV